MTKEELWKELSTIEEAEVRATVGKCKKKGCYGRGYVGVDGTTGKTLMCSCVKKAWTKVLKGRVDGNTANHTPQVQG